MSTESGVIEAVRLERIESVEIAGDIDRYEFRTDRPGRWLQRLCFWILGRLGAHADLHTVTIERHVIGEHGDTFMKRLLEQKFLLTAYHEPAEVLIGAEDYAALMGETTSLQAFEFDSRYFTGGGDGRPRIHGLRVRVIPWMRGLLVMP